MRLRAIREEREIPTEADLFERVRALARDNLARVGSAQDANADSSISEWSDSNFRKSLTNGNRHYNRCLDLICEVLAGLDPGQQPLDVKIEQQKARIWDGAPAQQVTRSSLSSERQGSAIALADDVPDSGAAAFETFRLDSIRYHEAAMADRQLALRHYTAKVCARCFATMQTL